MLVKAERSMCADVRSVVSDTHGAVGQIIERRGRAGDSEQLRLSGGKSLSHVFKSVSVSSLSIITWCVCVCVVVFVAVVYARRMWSSE